MNRPFGRFIPLVVTAVLPAVPLPIYGGDAGPTVATDPASRVNVAVAPRLAATGSAFVHVNPASPVRQLLARAIPTYRTIRILIAIDLAVIKGSPRPHVLPCRSSAVRDVVMLYVAS